MSILCGISFNNYIDIIRPIGKEEKCINTRK